MLKLVIRVDGREQNFETTEKVVTFGRSPENTIQVQDPKSSRMHCRLERTELGWKVVDLESSNGTAVNGELVNARILNDGDRFSIGAFEVVVNPPAVAAPAAGGVPHIVTAPAPHVEKHAPVVHMPAHRHVGQDAARESSSFAGFLKVAVLAVLLLAGTIFGVNKLYSGGNADQQRAAVKSAQKLAAAGDFDLAMQSLENLMKGPLDASVLREAKKSMEEIKGSIAKRDAEDKAKQDVVAAAAAANQKILDLQLAYDDTLAEADEAVATEKYGEALGMWKRFQNDNPDSALASKVGDRLKEVLKRAQDDWEALQERANLFSRREEYAAAAALVSSSVAKFTGTRFYYEAQDKLTAINRLAGVNAAYAGGTAKLSVKTQDCLLMVADYVKARRYGDALREFDKMLDAVPAAERGALDGQRKEIASQASLFGKLIEAVNTGTFAAFPTDLGNGTKATLVKATNEQLETAFKDPEGKGGSSSKRWAQVGAADMLAYFGVLTLSLDDKVTLASFCFSNGLADDGSTLLAEVIKKDSAREAAAFEMIARHRGIPVPAGGFVFYAGGWYTNQELQYAKLDLDAKRGAGLVGQVDPKKAAEGWAAWQKLSADPAATTDIKSRAQASYVAALKSRRSAILRALSNSGSLVNSSVMISLKKELNKRRADAIKVIYDKEIYPDADHGIVGQPKVDEAVGKVRELWDNPLQVVGKHSPVISDMIAASEQTDAWLTELGAALTDEEQCQFAELLARVNDALSLQNFTLDGGEKSQLEKYKAIMAYNERLTCYSDSEMDCIRATNEYRFIMGRQALEAHELLGNAARAHSVDMATKGFFAHESPTPGMTSPGDRCRAAKYPGGGIGENIAVGMEAGAAACFAWYNSSGHHRNMLSDRYNQIGIGQSGSYWTENLGSGASMMGKESTQPTDTSTTTSTTRGSGRSSVAGGTTGGGCGCKPGASGGPAKK